ncbi:MAG: hypothetical protein WDO70_01305 [Alphaproteobacteria bacterium]
MTQAMNGDLPLYARNTDYFLTKGTTRELVALTAPPREGGLHSPPLRRLAAYRAMAHIEPGSPQGLRLARNLLQDVGKFYHTKDKVELGIVAAHAAGTASTDNDSVAMQATNMVIGVISDGFADDRLDAKTKKHALMLYVGQTAPEGSALRDWAWRRLESSWPQQDEKKEALTSFLLKSWAREALESFKPEPYAPQSQLDAVSANSMGSQFRAWAEETLSPPVSQPMASVTALPVRPSGAGSADAQMVLAQ